MQLYAFQVRLVRHTNPTQPYKRCNCSVRGWQMAVVVVWWLLNIYWFYLLLLTATGKRSATGTPRGRDTPKQK